MGGNKNPHKECDHAHNCEHISKSHLRGEQETHEGHHLVVHLRKTRIACQYRCTFQTSFKEHKVYTSWCTLENTPCVSVQVHISGQANLLKARSESTIREGRSRAHIAHSSWALSLDFKQKNCHVFGRLHQGEFSLRISEQLGHHCSLNCAILHRADVVVPKRHVPLVVKFLIFSLFPVS